MQAKSIPADWPLQITVIGLGKVKRGAKFYGTKRQLIKHLRILNSVNGNGIWDVDRVQLPDEKIPV